MTTLVVHAHPVDDSLSGALFDAVVAELERASRTVETVRLGRGERLLGHHFEAARDLIFIYPTWYGSLPAMLLAQLSDVLGPWIDGDRPKDLSPLRSVRSLRVVTTHGSSKLVNLAQGEPGRLLWKRTVRPLCAKGAVFGWKALYKLDRNTAAERSAFIAAAAQFAGSPQSPSSMAARAR